MNLLKKSKKRTSILLRNQRHLHETKSYERPTKSNYTLNLPKILIPARKPENSTSSKTTVRLKLRANYLKMKSSPVSQLTNMTKMLCDKKMPDLKPKHHTRTNSRKKTIDDLMNIQDNEKFDWYEYWGFSEKHVRKEEEDENYFKKYFRKNTIKYALKQTRTKSTLEAKRKGKILLSEIVRKNLSLIYNS